MTIDEFIFSRKVFMAPFPANVIVTVNVEEYNMVVGHLGIVDAAIPDDAEAYVVSQTSRSDGRIRCVMMINPLSGDMTSPAHTAHIHNLLAHEIQHLVTRLQRVYGYTAPNENEPVSYLIGYLYRDISSIIFGAIGVQVAGYSYTTSRLARTIESMPEQYLYGSRDIPRSVASSALINYYYAWHNNQVYPVNNGYSATTYWW